MLTDVIIVDDTELKRQNISGIIRYLLSNACVYEFSTVNAGLRFILQEDMLQKQESCLIITDMCMPILVGCPVKDDGGKRLIRELSRRGCRFPVIIDSTGYVDVSEIQYDDLLGVVSGGLGLDFDNTNSYIRLLKGYIGG